MAKVLVVEDQPSMQAIVKYHFENSGYEGVFADTVDDGWRMLVTESPDALVTDISLPGADGWTLIERVRGDGRFHQVPIVVLTGQVDEETARKAGSLGCDYLTKPLSATALLSKLRAVLADSGSPRRTVPRPPDAPPGPVRVPVVAVGVVILLDNYQIEGTVHLPPELSRFSDAWESVVRDPRTFFPVTDARISTADGHLTLSSPPFVEIRKTDVRAVFPMDVPPAE
ncbi:MAG: response regulator [Actinomycetota bacterium]|nr:response regulator [Actinomycetota bacterium]